MATPALFRRLNLADAVFIGLGSMLGAGIFASFAPAADAAGVLLLAGLGIAAVVACCNATSSAQLAAQYPSSGGTYLYGRERLGPWWGFLAGWAFVIGKTASCAAMALAFAAYAVPEPAQRPVAALAVAVVAAIGYRGVTRTAQATRVIVVVVLVTLSVVVAAGAASGLPRLVPATTDAGSADAFGVLQSAALLFFAFAGYARIATMGEEVRDPGRTIPRAIVLALTGALVVYVGIAVTALGVLGPSALARSSAPLVDVVLVQGWTWAAPVVQIGAAAAALGALLALVAGVGRTALAMGRESDLPRGLAAVHPRFGTPHRAEVALAVVVIVLVLTIDLRGAIGFSSFGVLLYYFVANLAAITQSAPHRRYPRVLQVIGMIGCLVLVAALPFASIAVGLTVLVVGVIYRLVALRRGGLAPRS